MTGSQVKGKSFRGALRYNQEKVVAGKAEVLDNSFVNVTERNIMKEVAMVRMQRPDFEKILLPHFHQFSSTRKRKQ